MEQNLSMIRGDTASLGLELIDFDQDLDAVYFSCKKDYNTEEYVFQKSLGDGVEKLETGKYTIRIAPEDTENVSAGQYYYDLEISANSDVFTVLIGVLNIQNDVTRR